MKLSLHDADAPINTCGTNKTVQNRESVFQKWHNECNCKRHAGSGSVRIDVLAYRFSAVDAGIIDSSEMEFIFCNHTFCLPSNARKSPLKSRFICICMSIEHDDPCETLLRTRIDRKKNEWVHPIRRIPSEWAILFKLRQTDRTYVDVIVAMKWACKLCRCEPPMLGRDSVSAFAIFVLRLSTQFYR